MGAYCRRCEINAGTSTEARSIYSVVKPWSRGHCETPHSRAPPQTNTRASASYSPYHRARWTICATQDQPTYKPSLRGSDGCADDADWLYDAGDKGLKGCDHIASEPAKVDKRCSRRVGEDGVPALEACKRTCGKC